MSQVASSSKPKGYLRGALTPPQHSPNRSVSGGVPPATPAPGGVPPTPPATLPIDPDPILRTSDKLVREKPLRREITPAEFFADTTALTGTPYRASTRGVHTEPLTKPFEYAENVMDVLKARGYQPKGAGITLDGPNARKDFLALRSAMVTVLDSVDPVETAKIFDMDLAYSTYNFDINSIVFTMLSVLLRGAALATYHSAARSYPFDGRALLLRLHFDIEGVQRGDRGRYMEAMRALRVDERVDPNDTLQQLRTLGDEHRRLHPDFDDEDLVDTLLVVLEKSADDSPYEIPLYQNIITTLYNNNRPTFDTVVLNIRRTWAREGASRAARLPASGGAEQSSAPAGGVRTAAFRMRPVVPADGKWEDSGGPYRQWVGSGRPCLVCYRVYGLTDVHQGTDGICPWSCVEAFSTGRAPKTSQAAPTRPEPPTRPALRSFRPSAAATSLQHGELGEPVELLTLQETVNPAPEPGTSPPPALTSFAAIDEESDFPAFNVDIPPFPSERRGPVWDGQSDLPLE